MKEVSFCGWFLSSIKGRISANIREKRYASGMDSTPFSAGEMDYILQFGTKISGSSVKALMRIGKLTVHT